MTTPTLREALARISVALEESDRNGALPYSLEGLWEMADEALAAQPELPEPVAHLKKNGFKFNADIEPDDYETEVKLYTVAQLQQAVEQAQAKREPMTREQMRDIFLTNGFTVKEGQDDLKDYVYAAGRAIETHHNIGDKA